MFFGQRNPEVVLHMCSSKKVSRKYAAKLQEDTHAEVQFQ